MARSRTITPADAAKGAAAGRIFQAWLDRSVLPHMYVEQFPLTVPVPLGQIRRPHYLVGIPGVGLTAFDVEAATLYDGEMILPKCRSSAPSPGCFT